MAEKTESKKYHTDAIYRCRIVENKHNYYLVKQCAILKNNGDKKSLYIPRYNIYLNKLLVEEELIPGDYVSITLEFVDKKTNVTNVIEVTKSPRFTTSSKKTENTETDDKNSNKNSNKNRNKNSNSNSNRNSNMFGTLYSSDSESDSD